MSVRYSLLAAALVAVVVPGSTRAGAQASVHRSTWHVTQRIPLGGAGAWDFVTVDTASHRLFIARGDRVMVVDEVTGKSVGTIGGMRGAQHMALDPATGHGFVTSGVDGAVAMFSLGTLKVLARTAAAPDARAIVVDSVSQRVFSFNGESHSITVLDVRSGAKLKTIGLTGSPEFGMADGTGHIIFNNASRAEVAVLDTRSMKVVRHWSIAPCRQPSGLALDTAHERVFSVCSNRRMAISSTRGGRLLKSITIGAEPDGVVFDSASGDALSANGDGTITVVHEDSPTVFRKVQTLTTMRGARTIALDPVSHRAYTVATGPGAGGVFTLLVVER